MSRKMTSAIVYILALLLATVPAWSATPGPINPVDSGKSLTTDLNTATDYTIKTEIILAAAAVAEMEAATVVRAGMVMAAVVRAVTATVMAVVAAVATAME